MGLTAETGNYKRITSELAAGLETRKSPRDSRGDFRVSKTGEVFGIQWCRRGESNPRPRDYETLALPLSYAGLKAIVYATNEPPQVSNLGCELRCRRNASSTVRQHFRSGLQKIVSRYFRRIVARRT